MGMGSGSAMASQAAIGWLTPDLTAAARGKCLRPCAVLTLIHDEGMSGATTTQIFGRSIKAVKRLLARSRAFLREPMLAADKGEEN